jgi:hypothetical protein
MAMWKYKGEEFNEEEIKDNIAFVYLITNLVSGRKYIGKKLFKFKKTSTSKGKKKRTLVESDWKDYWSSSEELKADVKNLGEGNFTREVLHLCKNKGTASYIEAKEQFAHLVLEKPKEWYNGIINCRVHRNHVKL